MENKMKKAILTESANPATQDIDLMTGVEIAATINAEDQKTVLAVQTQLKPIGKAIDLIAKSFLKMPVIQTYMSICKNGLLLILLFFLGAA